jgi:hypothetical protein
MILRASIFPAASQLLVTRGSSSLDIAPAVVLAGARVVCCRLVPDRQRRRDRVCLRRGRPPGAGEHRTTGEAVRYAYDAAGNITSQISGPITTLAVGHFSPRRGPVGTHVTINGTGFDPTPANNAVRFNGVAVAVIAATQPRLSPPCLHRRLPVRSVSRSRQLP